MKRFPLLICVVLTLAGCAGGPSIRYNVPPSAPTAGLRQEHAGVYRGSLTFRALTIREKQAYRVIILSDIGMKLIDMRVTPDGVDVFSKADFLPRRVVVDFSRFYTAWAFDPARPTSSPHLWIKPL